MPITYNTIQDKHTYSVSHWSYQGAADYPCSCPYSEYDTYVSGTGIPTNSSNIYEPVIVDEIRPERSIKGRTGSMPPYSMTPYYRSKITTSNYTYSKNNGANYKAWYQQRKHVSYVGGSCVLVIDDNTQIGPYCDTWTEVSHVVPPGTPNYVLNVIDNAGIVDAIGQIQDDISTASLINYDLLTEIAELKDIPKMVASHAKDVTNFYLRLRYNHSLSDLRYASKLKPRDLLRSASRALRKIGAEWMSYRYGIMPLAYSCIDIVKAVNRGAVVKKNKATSVPLRSTGVTKPGSSVNYTWTVVDGSVTVMAHTYQLFLWSQLAAASGVAFNLATTAWELIPYSFVADWFVNVGDSITRATTTSYASSAQACYSLRINTNERTFYHRAQNNITLNCSQIFCTNFRTIYGQSMPAVPPPKVISNPESDDLIHEVNTQSYSRHLFDMSAAKLRFNPSLNWRRGCDAAVMALQLLSKVSKFKKFL